MELVSETLKDLDPAVFSSEMDGEPNLQVGSEELPRASEHEEGVIRIQLQESCLGNGAKARLE